MGQEVEGKLLLNNDEYRQLVFKILNNEDVDIKISGEEDTLMLYLHEPLNNVYIEAALNMESRELTSNINNGMVVDNFLDGKMNLLHAETQRDQMFNQIVSEVEGLKADGIPYDEDAIYRKTFTLFENDLISDNAKTNINNLYQEFEKNENIINKIDNLLEKVDVYQKNYNDEMEIMNLSIYDDSFKQDSTIDVYKDSWHEMKKGHEKFSELLKVSLKHETEKFIKDHNSIQLPKLYLNHHDTQVAEHLYKQEQNNLSIGQLIPLVAKAHENEVTERLRNSFENYYAVKHLETPLQYVSYTNKDFSLDGSKLKEHLDNLKENAVGFIIKETTNELKEIYGNYFEKESIFNEMDLINTSNLVSKMSPILERDTFSLQELAMVEPVTKSEYATRDFWEKQNDLMLEDYLRDKGEGLLESYREIPNSSIKLEELGERIFDIHSTDGQLADKQLSAIAEKIQDAINTNSHLQQEIVSDRIELKPTSNNKEDIQLNNRLNNSLNYLRGSKLDLEITLEYVNLAQNEREMKKENQKEPDFER